MSREQKHGGHVEVRTEHNRTENKILSAASAIKTPKIAQKINNLHHPLTVVFIRGVRVGIRLPCLKNKLLKI